MKYEIKLETHPFQPYKDPDPPHVARLHKRLGELFVPYGIKRRRNKPGDMDYHYQDFTAPAGDPEVERRLAQFREEVLAVRKMKGKGVYASVNIELTPAEVGRARYLRLQWIATDANEVEDDDGDWREINKWPACKACGTPQITRVPKPFLVTDVVRKKGLNFFGTSRGLLVVRRPVRDLLVAAIGDQIETGEAKLAKGAPFKGDDQVFWVRPKHTLKRLAAAKTCKACKALLDPRFHGDAADDDVDLTNSDEPQVQYSVPRRELPSFGPRDVDLARGEPLCGSTDPDSAGFYYEIFISGGLYAYLKQNGVKGMRVNTEEVLFSAKGEPAIEAEPRRFGALSPAAGKMDDRAASRNGMDPKLAAKLAKLPWDVGKDKYVYFHLSTPELYVTDPMMFDDNQSMTFKLKNFAPGLHRLPVSAIKDAGRKKGVSVDSATLLFVDGAYLSDLAEAYRWEDSMTPRGYSMKYLNDVCKQIGTRFGICSLPGDGEYTINTDAIERMAG